MDGSLDEEELIDKIKNISILGIRSKTKISKKVIDSANKLLSIGAFCIGTNQIKLDECNNSGVIVFNAPYSNTRSVVEIVIAQMINLMRKIVTKSNDMHSGVWKKDSIDSYEIRNKIIGIVGYGNIGSQLSVICEALGMKVIYYDILDKLSIGNAKKCKSLNELLRQSDIISLHVDGRDINSKLISDKEGLVPLFLLLILNVSLISAGLLLLYILEPLSFLSYQSVIISVA
jgi:D-3-phosphoglycerate dehydrogenase